jgi:hypothetical protein
MQVPQAQSFGLGRSPVAPILRNLPHYFPQKDYAE